MFRFTIRDVLWLTVVVGMGVAWWLARTYHMTRIPGVARKIRAIADWTVGLPFGRDVAEVGSIGHPRPLRAAEYARGGTHRPLD